MMNASAQIILEKAVMEISREERFSFEMNTSLERVFIITGVINVLGNILILLSVLVSGQRTPTHIYLLYMIGLSLLKQLISPTIMYLCVRYFPILYDLGQFLSLTYIFLLIGLVFIIFLLLFMDYFQWISYYKYTIILVHFFATLFLLLTYYFTTHHYERRILVIAMLHFILLLVFLSTLIVHRDINYLKIRQKIDDESGLRYGVVLTYTGVCIFTVMVFVVEQLIGTRRKDEGYLTMGFYQLDTIFYLFALIKCDDRLRNSLVDLLTKCSFCKRPRKVQTESRPAADGVPINQNLNMV